MKFSMITLLELACLMQGTLASPFSAKRHALDMSPTTADKEMVKRGVLDGPVIPGLPDISTLPNLSALSALVTIVVATVETVEAIISGAKGGDITNVLPELQNQLASLSIKLGDLRAITSTLSSTSLDVPDTAGLSVLLAHLLNGLAFLLASINSVSHTTGGSTDPITGLLSSIVAAIGSGLNLGMLTSGVSGAVTSVI